MKAKLFEAQVPNSSVSKHRATSSNASHSNV